MPYIESSLNRTKKFRCRRAYALLGAHRCLELAIAISLGQKRQSDRPGAVIEVITSNDWPLKRIDPKGRKRVGGSGTSSKCSTGRLYAFRVH